MVSENLGPQFEDYRGRHRPADRTYGASFDNPTNHLPNVHEHPEYYTGYNFAKARREFPAIAAGEQRLVQHLRRARGNPDYPVTVYRAVPTHVNDIRPGDWVTPNPGYADQHRYNISPDLSDSHVISATARAADLHTDGDLNEWGWNP